MEHVCEVGDIFEYPETGEYEKLRGERIVVLEKGKGCNPDHTYIRVLCFRPNAESDSFHFSCNDRYMDKVLEHWRFVGHMDISLLTGGKEEKKEKEKDWSKVLSNFASYDDLVIRGKVDYDQINRVKIGEDTIEFETVDKNIRELQKENEGLKKEIDILKSKVNLLLDRTARLDKIARLMSR